MVIKNWFMVGRKKATKQVASFHPFKYRWKDAKYVETSFCATQA